ncbi:MAG TPA: hypothetical protein VHV30_17380 [Polyangiaceae bacterium]|jgi:hypothetical protein|nr:hypothetical protein [Polyangiaceae bacterium]
MTRDGVKGACLAIAVVAVLAGAGCHDLETIGILAADAGETVSRVTDAAIDAGALVVTIDECAAGGAPDLDAATIHALTSGGRQGAVRWLYPYDGTVFPGGMLAPLLMWSDDDATDDVVYLHIHSSSFDYRACTKPTAPGQLQVPQKAWAIAGEGTAGAADPFSLEITVLAGETVLGPASEKVVIATAPLPGSVYYMSLASKQWPAPAAVIAVPPGQSAQLALGETGCYGCHSLAAGGSRLIAYASGMGGSFALSGGAASNPPSLSGSVPGGEAPGITPDGTLYVSSAHPAGVNLKTYGSFTFNAGLYDAVSGASIPDSGVPAGAMFPAFSPDGRSLVFNDFAIESGKGLAIQDFSESARQTSNYRQLYTDPMNYPAWPSFLPDDSAVIFQLGSSPDYSGDGTGLGISSAGPPTDLYLVDTKTQAVTILARAMGFATAADVASGTTYLPFGGGETHENYGTSVFPVAAGGYAWVLFDSMRHYGNAGQLRQIWGAAIDVAPDGAYVTDPSHPAFFLPGQEIGAENFHAVAAMDP